jgi:hypothetical protein
MWGSHEECVREECYKARESIYIKWTNSRIECLQTVEGQETSVFRDGSDTYLIEKQYAMVKHVGLNFISYLLCFFYF